MNKSTNRLWILAAFLGLSFGIAMMLPDSGAIKPSMLATKLPDTILNLSSVEGEVGYRERKVLAKDTDFERRKYYNPLDEDSPIIEISIVFSGKDMNNSIHRPEVCLRAQGWNFIEEEFVNIETASESVPQLPMKKIVCEKVLYDGTKLLLTTDGKPVKIRRVFYYTFFGHKQIVAGHFERVGEDMKDRLFGGYDQRWAYATFSSSLVKLRDSEQGVIEEKIPQQLCEDEIKKIIRNVIENHVMVAN